MVTADGFRRFLLILPGLFNNQSSNTVQESSSEPEWSYANTINWDLDYPECGGYRQSPIRIQILNTVSFPTPPLIFHDYNAPLGGLSLENNGHSVNMDIPPVVGGTERPSISGGKLLGRYEAVGVHFHWGSALGKGSEHWIDDIQYDVEMHVVHKNVRYATVDEATQYIDGLAVLGVMFSVSPRPAQYPGLNKIFNKLPQVTQYKSTVSIDGPLTLGQLLGDLRRKEFYTYKGSLTTPPCSEAVTWMVFPDALPISRNQIKKFWKITDSHNDPLVDNFRETQPLDGRIVIHRIPKGF